ncbi:hypothetical protein LTR33_002034 [Friedmanniomyces endolithicus]|nr:hypothetical protein LTR33_002034 [Friedmanniomyces endolithicus]
MVLEDAATADTFNSTDLAPSSDFDPYESASSNPTSSVSGDTLRIDQTSNRNPAAAPITINLNELPRRWSFTGTRSHPDILYSAVRSQCATAANVLQRPVTQDEANALAFHFAKSIRMASYGSPAGVAIAVGLAYRGNSNYRFPLWTPITEGGRFSKDVFGPLKGFQARVAWQCCRVSAYVLVGSVMGQLFFGSYALSISATGRAMDSRLKEFNEALRQSVRSGLGREGARRVEDESAGAKGMETYDMARQRRSAQEVGRRGRQQSAAVADDASPTGGAFSDDFTGADEVGFPDEQQVRQKADAQVAASRSPPSPSARTSNNSTSQTPQAAREAQPQPSSGSSWDRLRQGAMAAQPSDASKGMAPSRSAGSRASALANGSETSNDSFSFSSNDTDRELAKSEAQSEFDARLERERAGKDFSQGGGGRKW